MDGMWLITTSLEALIQRACNVANAAPDQDAIDAICGFITKVPECCGTAAKLIVAKAHSSQEWEAMQALLVLENCMKRCGARFHSEVGKFRFLNELIKLVSPKYFGGQTAAAVKTRVLELMADWASSYSKEPKIKEAYDMLKKQGVIQEEKTGEKPLAQVASSAAGTQSASKPLGFSVFDEGAQLLQNLLRSSKPSDLQAANKLIKYMVKEDERRTEEKWKSATELETAVTQCSLLNDMLDRFAKEGGGAADIDLMAELHTGCLALHPALIRLAFSNPLDKAFSSEVLAAQDELSEVLAKYRSVMGDTSRNPLNPSTNSAPSTVTLPPVSNAVSEPSLLDLSPGPVTAAYSVVEPPAVTLLEDIFGAASTQIPPVTEGASQETLTNGMASNGFSSQIHDNSSRKSKALEELDMLGESMLKEILHSSAQQNKPPPKVTMNDLLLSGRKSSLAGVDEISQNVADLNVSASSSSQPPVSEETPPKAPSLPTTPPCDVSTATPCPPTSSDLPLASGAFPLSGPPPSSPAVSLTDEPLLGATPVATPARCPTVQPAPLSDISLTIADVKPSSVTPYRENVGELSLIITLAKDRPREDVSVHVITTTSTHSSPIEQFLFQPVVPKSCRLRLLPPSSTALPQHNPFLPPAAITQIMLIASPSKDPIKMKYVISYVMEEETITEMCEVTNLPLRE